MTRSNIIDAINRLLVERWPDRTVYIDVCPVDFDRPSFWLSSEPEKITRINPFMEQHEVNLLLTLFDEKDEHYEISWQRLDEEVDQASAVIGTCLRVGERALTLAKNVLPRLPDRAQIRITTMWMEPTARGEESVPEDLDIHIAVAVQDMTGEKTIIEDLGG